MTRLSRCLDYGRDTEVAYLEGELDMADDKKTVYTVYFEQINQDMIVVSAGSRTEAISKAKTQWALRNYPIVKSVEEEDES